MDGLRSKEKSAIRTGQKAHRAQIACGHDVEAREEVAEEVDAHPSEGILCHEGRVLAVEDGDDGTGEPEENNIQCRRQCKSGPAAQQQNAGAYVTGSQLKRLGEYYAKAIHANYGDDFDVLFGPAYKGIPLAVVTAIAYHELYGKEVRYCSDRKEAKDHGADKGGFLGSKLKDGDRVVMIEDVTTSGKSMEETVPKVREAADVTIVGLMVSLNRMEVGQSGRLFVQ